jgi:hypothetical protein
MSSIKDDNDDDDDDKSCTTFTLASNKNFTKLELYLMTVWIQVYDTGP